jgi:hypothetical protein
MVFAVLAVMGLILGLLHVAIRRQWTTRRIADVLLPYFFAFPIGLGGVFGFIGHTMRAGPVAASIGWAAGNPFQYEVAVANLAFGILGILCLWNRGGFWTATAIGWSILCSERQEFTCTKFMPDSRSRRGTQGPFFISTSSCRCSCSRC